MTPQATPAARFRRQAIGLGCVLVALIVFGTVLQYLARASIGELLRSTATAQAEIAAARDVLDGLQDAETGQRGYLLTLRPAYLEPYRQASAMLGPAFGRLQAVAARSPWLPVEAAELQRVAERKLAELRRTVEMVQEGRVTDALAVLVTDEGKTLMDDARRRVANIVDRAEAERVAQTDLLQARQSALAVGTQSALVLGLLLLGAALLLAMRNRARLAETQAAERVVAGRFKAAVEKIRDGVAVFDSEGRLNLHNERFAAALGVDPGVVRDGAAWSVVAGATALAAPVLADTLPQAPVAQEVRQGERTLEIWRGAMPDGGQILAVADITRRVQAEEIARQSQKMEVLGQMTGGVAHDFNNLLQVVSANLELVAKRLGRAEPRDEWMLARIEAARAGVARGARLTRHLLAFARRQPLAPETLEPARLLTGMDDMLRRTMGGGIELELVVGGGLWSVRADPNQLENALLNLALNARDAMVPDESGIATGHLTIEAVNAALDEVYAASVAEVTPGQYVMFAVSDTGVGMTSAELARATEPFYTTKGEGRGTGLGLSMVFGFAKQSGGHFQLYSEPGRGTTARLYLPRTTAESRPQRAPVTEAAAAGELVLLVEDDPGVRQAAAETLSSLGYAVAEAANAEAGLALIEQGLAPDVLFTDVVMPGPLSSRALAEQAQALRPGLAVLFTSGYTQNAIVHNGQLDRGIHLISKPWRAEDLAQRLQSVLAQAREDRMPSMPAYRVVLVEDDALARMMVADMLADCGHEVVEAATGQEALGRLTGAEVLIVDVGLPDMDGLALAETALARMPGLRVVVASGQVEDAEGRFVWLTKPFDRAALQSAITQAMA